MFKTRMLAKASVSEVVTKELTDIDIYAAKARAKEEVVTLEAQKDLMRLVSILVSTGMNRNDDVFLREEVLPIRNTGAHKPVNLEHDAEQIVGHMTKTYVTLKDGTIIDDKDNNVPEDFDLTNEAVIYKFIFPEVAQYIKEKAAANSLFVSIEMWFDDYDYLLDNIIVRRNADTSSILDKHLKINGGEGFYEGRKLGRVLRNCLIAGIGIVKNPANLESVIKSVSSVDSKFVLIEDKAIVSNVLGSVDTYGKVTAMIKGDEAKLLNTKAQEVDMVLPNPAEPVLVEPALPEGSIAPTITTIPVPVEVPVTPLMKEVMEEGNVFMAKDEEDIVIGHLSDIINAKLEEIKNISTANKASASEAVAVIDGFAVTADIILAERDMYKQKCAELEASLAKKDEDMKEMHKKNRMHERRNKMMSELGMTPTETDQEENDEHICDMTDEMFGLYFRTAKKNRKGMCQVSTNNAKEGGLTPVVANQEPAVAPTPAPVAAPVQPTAPVTEPAPVADPAPTAPVAPVAEPKAPEAPATPAPQTVVAPEVPVVPPAPIVEPVVEPAPIPPAPVVDAVPSLDKVQPVDPPIAVVTNNPTAPSITQQMGEVLIDLLSRSNPKWKNLKL